MSKLDKEKYVKEIQKLKTAMKVSLNYEQNIVQKQECNSKIIANNSED